MSVTPPSSYRPHNPGHDYFSPGIYLITLVTRGRCVHFGRLNDDVRAPGVVLSEVGRAVMECWQRIPAHHALKGRELRLHGAVCMPDHFHGVIEVVRPMDVPLGEVIRGFKAGCTMAWRACGGGLPGGVVRPGGVELPGGVAQQSQPGGLGQPSMAAPSAPIERPYLDALPFGTTPPLGTTPPPGATLPIGTALSLGIAPLLDRDQIKRLSKHQRALYYAAHPEAQQPLFDDNYDDTICLTDPMTGQYDPRHYQAMVGYVQDNPRRAIIRHLNPQFMEHRQHIQIAGHDYAAFGNLFLLRWARKVQVFCHRRSPDGRSRYVDTEAFREDCRRWKAQLMEGATVLVTPGISPGELLIKNRCIERGYPLIHLQKEPIPPFKKPEKTRFDACAAGRMLILSPWQADELGDYNGVPSQTEYSIFHNMNDLAARICEWQGEMKWLHNP